MDKEVQVLATQLAKLAPDFGVSMPPSLVKRIAETAMAQARQEAAKETPLGIKLPAEVDQSVLHEFGEELAKVKKKSPKKVAYKNGIVEGYSTQQTKWADAAHDIKKDMKDWAETLKSQSFVTGEMVVHPDTAQALFGVPVVASTSIPPNAIFLKDEEKLDPVDLVKQTITSDALLAPPPPFPPDLKLQTVLVPNGGLGFVAHIPWAKKIVSKASLPEIDLINATAKSADAMKLHATQEALGKFWESVKAEPYMMLTKPVLSWFKASESHAWVVSVAALVGPPATEPQVSTQASPAPLGKAEPPPLT